MQLPPLDLECWGRPGSNDPRDPDMAANTMAMTIARNALILYLDVEWTETIWEMEQLFFSLLLTSLSYGKGSHTCQK